MLVSIHASAWGATLKNRSSARIIIVSIHAPAWGATGVTPKRSIVSECFNPRARVGRDPQVADDIDRVVQKKLDKLRAKGVIA